MIAAVDHKRDTKLDAATVVSASCKDPHQQVMAFAAVLKEVLTLMVQSVDPENRRRSWYMARQTTAPVCPVSRCSSVVARAPLPSSPPGPAPLAVVQLDSSSSSKLPANAMNCSLALPKWSMQTQA